MPNLEGLSERALDEFIRFTTGDKIGEGMSRSVYLQKNDSSKVIKIEQHGRCYQNIIEWITWQELKHTKHAKWLAPCHDISPCGLFLVMERALPLRPNEIPKSLPSWLGDHKLANFGMIGMRVVCHDYGTNMLLNHGAFNGKMQKTRFGATND